MSVQFEELEERLPSHLPLSTKFEHAILSARQPLEVLASVLSNSDSSCWMEETPGSIGAVIRNFLEQLDYIHNYARLNGEPIIFAEIEHPFSFKKTRKGEAGSKRGGEE